MEANGTSTLVIGEKFKVHKLINKNILLFILYQDYSTTKLSFMNFRMKQKLSIMEYSQVIVDTMSAWDKELILGGLEKHDLIPDDITHVGECTSSNQILLSRTQEIT